MTHSVRGNPPAPTEREDRQPSATAIADLSPFLAAPSATMPVWLAGGRLAFVSDRSGMAQIWVTDPVGSADFDPDTGIGVTQLIELPNRVTALKADPAGTAIIFGMDEGGNEHQQVWYLPIPGGDPAQSAEPEPLTADPEVIHNVGAVSTDGHRLAFSSNQRDRRFFDVSVLGLGEGASGARTLVEADALLYPVAYSPDGSRLLIRRNNSNLDQDLLMLDDGASELRLLTAHDGEATILDVAFAPDGQSLLVATNEGGEFSALVRLGLDGQRLEVLAEPEWDVELVRASPASGWIAYSVNEDGVSRLWLRDGSGIEQRIDDLPAGTIDGAAWSTDGGWLAVTLTSPVASGAVWLVSVDGTATPAVPAVYGGLDPAALVYPEIIRYRSFDGREIPAFWFVPDGEGPFPVVVDVHGGPESQRRADWQPLPQFLVHQGFAVLATNVRGSTGYGRTYCHLDDRERRYDSVADLGAAHDWLRAREEVDSEFISIHGRSYGGFMVLAALTTQPGRWTTGIDVVGIANFVSFFANTGAWRRSVRAAEYGDPETQADLLRDLSPIHRVGAIRAPLFVMHGRNDPRVPLDETLQIVQAIQERDGVVELIVFDDEGHGPVRRPNRLRGYGLVSDFLDRYGRPS